MTPRTGRPPKQGSGKSRTANSLTIRVTDEEKKKIQMIADNLNISRTDAILRGIDLLIEQNAKN